MLAERVDVVMASIPTDTPPHPRLQSAWPVVSSITSRSRLTCGAIDSSPGSAPSTAPCGCGGHRGRGTYGARADDDAARRGRKSGRGRPAIEAEASVGAKTDSIDAVRFARKALVRDHFGVPRSKAIEAIRVLLTTRAGGGRGAGSVAVGLPRAGNDCARGTAGVAPVAHHGSAGQGLRGVSDFSATKQPPVGSRLARGKRPARAGTRPSDPSGRARPPRPGRDRPPWSLGSSWPPGRLMVAFARKQSSPNSPAWHPSQSLRARPAIDSAGWEVCLA